MSDWNKCDWRIANGSVQPHQSELQIDSTSNSIKWSVYCENAQRSIEWVQAVGAPEMLVYRTTVKMLLIYWYRLHRKYRIGFTNYYAQFSCIGFLGQKHDRIFSSAKWIVERIRGWVCNLSIAFIIFCGKRVFYWATNSIEWFVNMKRFDINFIRWQFFGHMHTMLFYTR